MDRVGKGKTIGAVGGGPVAFYGEKLNAKDSKWVFFLVIRREAPSHIL